ncbi:hypothetical protein HHI36_001648 [Cryptolaemus montrouzieri]|uniref:JNK1/MAPK8-associated membrane protein n=1 Tax=Cryptolaemus montrouzieri TaxID=559131 RepID=A0ABD2P8K0_9CUCU
MKMLTTESCPGWYCGRQILDSGELSECGSCPRAYRRNDSYICVPCTDSPTFYDWLYLGFMVVFLLILHWFFIDLVSMRRRSLTDWYTLLHNPDPNYEETIHCTQEAVYPLYSIIFLFYTMNLLCMFCFRTWVCRKVMPGPGKMSIYAAMYYLPILAVSHALIGGLLYYAFPYLIVVMSVISCAVHFAFSINQTVFSLIMTSLTSPRNIIILMGHWCLHFYGIISITEFTDPLFHSLLILLVPLPTLFYIFTARFTNPKKFDKS